MRIILSGTVRIGVLALQGDVSEHVELMNLAIERLGMDAVAVAVRKLEQLERVSALLIPGGESTTISKQMKRFGLFDRMREMAIGGMPVMGTCAGCIIVARELLDQRGPEAVETLGLVDIAVNRNAYGRQRESFEKSLEIEGMEDKFTGIFIRAPTIEETGQGVEVLATLNGQPVMVRQGNVLALTFHPELSNDPGIHELFLRMI